MPFSATCLYLSFLCAANHGKNCKVGFFVEAISAALLLMEVYTCFGATNRACDSLRLPCHLGSHIPSSGVDLLFAVFLCVQTVVWLPVFVNFNVCKVLIHAPAHKGSINMVGVCTES